ncbi:MAG TPA: sigma factor, partial [Gemmataceae bacterium]|nr:sigma factor [Gemmataceae bacterium]
MSRGSFQSVIRQIHHLAGRSDTGQLTDRQLLERFVQERDESAFALLVRRHGPLVLGVGGRILHHTHDAEDVFQATFLVLARKAGSRGWQASIRNWLYQVAYRLAMKAKATAARRHVQERNAVATPRQEETSDAAWRELCSLLDE